MDNVHRLLNQDDVLGDEEELSPSAFPPEGAPDDEVKIKKKSGLMPMIGGIAIAVAMVGIFGWKILSPYLNRGKQVDAFEPISANMMSERPREVAPSPIDPMNQHSSAAPHQGAMPMPDEPAPGQIQPAAQQPMVGQSQQAPLLEPGGTPRSTALVPQAQPVANAGPAVQISPVAAPASVQQAPVANDELMRVNRRIDELQKSIASIQDAVNKLTLTVNSASQKPVNIAAKPVVAAPVTAAAKVAPKPVALATPKVTAAKPKIVATPVERESAPIAEKADLTSPRADVAQRPNLKAVLDGRAWFQTKSGESITVTPGEEVPGIGIVKSIDIDRGEVRFANGVVIR